MTGRLIDADELLKHKSDHETISTHLIWNAPTVDAEPVRHGKWKQVSEPYVTSALRFYVCTACGEKSVGATKYCPSCGAKMDGEE